MCVCVRVCVCNNTHVYHTYIVEDAVEARRKYPSIEPWGTFEFASQNNHEKDVGMP